MKTEKQKEEHPKVYEESEVPFYNPPAQNAFEKARSSDFDQSGMKK